MNRFGVAFVIVALAIGCLAIGVACSQQRASQDAPHDTPLTRVGRGEATILVHNEVGAELPVLLVAFTPLDAPGGEGPAPQSVVIEPEDGAYRFMLPEDPTARFVTALPQFADGQQPPGYTYEIRPLLNASDIMDPSISDGPMIVAMMHVSPVDQVAADWQADKGLALSWQGHEDADAYVVRLYGGGDWDRGCPLTVFTCTMTGSSSLTVPRTALTKAIARLERITVLNDWYRPLRGTVVSDGQVVAVYTTLFVEVTGFNGLGERVYLARSGQLEYEATDPAELGILTGQGAK